MPNHVIVDIGESLAQIGVVADAQVQERYSWVFSRDPQMKGAIEWLKGQLDGSFKPDAILLCNRHALTQYRRRFGTPPAVIVTRGFSDWLDLHRPPQPSHFRLEARRPRSFLEKDLIFEVSERVSASGELITPLDINELEFLVGKLQLLDVKQVAICFLHPESNPANEKAAWNYFSEKGFRVLASHQLGPSASETERWLATALSLYLFEDVNAVISAAQAMAKEVGLAEEIVHLCTSLGVRPAPLTQHEVLPSLFGWQRALQLAARNQNMTTIAHLDCEGIVSVSARSDESLWLDEVGRFTVRKPKSIRSSVQPTQSLGVSPWGNLELIGDEHGLEPGPLCWGKSLVPQWLDLLWAEGRLKDDQDFMNRSQPKMEGRIREHLSALTRSSQFDGRGQIEGILKQVHLSALRRLIMELDIDGSGELMLVGPLVGALRSLCEDLVESVGRDILRTWRWPNASTSDDGSGDFALKALAMMGPKGGTL